MCVEKLKATGQYKKALIECFERAKTEKDVNCISVGIRINCNGKSYNKLEIISKDGFDCELDNILKNYDDDLCLKDNKDVKIECVAGVKEADVKCSVFFQVFGELEFV